MTNFYYIKKFQQLELEVAYNSLKEFSFGTLAYTQRNESIYENYILVNRLLNKGNLIEIEKEFLFFNRKSAIYFEEHSELLENKIFLQSQGYTKSWKDSWLFYKKLISNIDDFSLVRKVNTSEDMDIFLTVFDNSYQENDPKNPYGSVKMYLDSNKAKFLEHGKSSRLQYFIAYDKKEPVAVSILTSHEGLGYVSGVGSLQKVRGKGFGKLVTLYAVFISQQIGNKKHFLLTEEGTYPYEFYKRLGFISEFLAIGMFK